MKKIIIITSLFLSGCVTAPQVIAPKPQAPVIPEILRGPGPDFVYPSTTTDYMLPKDWMENIAANKKVIEQCRALNLKKDEVTDILLDYLTKTNK